MEIVTILDTTIGEDGPTQNINGDFLKLNTPLRIHCDLASGDAVVLQGRLSAAHSWDVLYTFNDETPVDINPSYQIRAIRSVDGTAGDSKVYVQNPFPTVVLTPHAA